MVVSNSEILIYLILFWINKDLFTFHYAVLCCLEAGRPGKSYSTH